MAFIVCSLLCIRPRTHDRDSRRAKQDVPHVEFLVLHVEQLDKLALRTHVKTPNLVDLTFTTCDGPIKGTYVWFGATLGLLLLIRVYACEVKVW